MTMAQVIIFDDACRKQSVEKYTEILHRRAMFRMAESERKHKEVINEYKMKHDKISSRFNNVCSVLLVIAFVAVAIYFGIN